MTVCANCGERIYRKPNGTWAHTYTTSDRCRDGRKIMPSKET